MEILKIENLSLGFDLSDGFYKALHNINLSFNTGEMHAIVGESGCGKSLSAMSILRLTPKNSKITSGKIIFDGENLLTFTNERMRKLRGKRIALIPQDPMTSLNPLYTIGNQLLEIIELHQNLKGEEAKNVAIKALQLVKIPDPEKRMQNYPHELSGGMKQRVIIAMAIACEADLIIADEPTTALDVTIQAQIMDILKEIKKNGTAIILITHDLGLVAQYCDKVDVMYAGKIVEHSDAKEIFIRPKHPYTQALIAALPDLNRKKLANIKGQPPSIKERNEGCPFYPRCEKRFEKCECNDPPLKKLGVFCEVACWLY